jgi:hypothetical protein
MLLLKFRKQFNNNNKQINIMKNAEIKWEEGKKGTLYIDGVKRGELRDHATMDDNGGQYFAYAGDNREYRIVWDTTEEWDNASERYQKELAYFLDPHEADSSAIDDESNACDWDAFEVRDESGETAASASTEN